MTRVLIVEDDATINSLIYEYLTEKDFDCRKAFSGTEGRLLFDMEKFDLILLDLMIPGLSGEELIAYIRSSSQVPVIVLSAKTALEDKVNLLSTGADDYLTKPFELEELLARIQVQLRHKAASPLLLLLFGIKTGSWMNRPEVSWSREKESILPPMSWEL